MHNEDKPMKATFPEALSRHQRSASTNVTRRAWRHRLAAASASLLFATSAPGQLKTDFAVMSFDDDLEGFVYLDLPELGEAMVEKTNLTIVSSRAERVVLVAGVLDARSGEILYGAVSQPILANRGQSGLIQIGDGPLRGAWDAFEDPLFGFEDPLFGFEEPSFGFEEPSFGFEEPSFGFEEPSFGFETGSEALDAIWGTNGVGFAPMTTPAFIWGTGGTAVESPEDILAIAYDGVDGEAFDGVDGEAYDGVDGEAYAEGTKLLIVTSFSLDPDSGVRHSAAILPFWAFSD